MGIDFFFFFLTLKAPLFLVQLKISESIKG